MTKLKKNHTKFNNPFESPEARNKLLSRIDAIDGYRGVRVVFYDGRKVHEIRSHPPVCSQEKRTIVIRPFFESEKNVVTHGVLSKQDDHNFYSELLSTGLSCGAAVISWIVVGGSSKPIEL